MHSKYIFKNISGNRIDKFEVTFNLKCMNIINSQCVLVYDMVEILVQNLKYVVAIY
jgi:hypothetical protein